MTSASSAIMKDASAVTPSTQFFPPLSTGSCIAILRLLRDRVTRRSRTRRTGRGEGCGAKYLIGDRILLGAPNVYRPGRDGSVAKPAMERMMKRTLIRYKTKPELADKNAQLIRSEEHTSELQSLTNLVCRLLLEKKKKKQNTPSYLKRVTFTIMSAANLAMTSTASQSESSLTAGLPPPSTTTHAMECQYTL